MTWLSHPVSLLIAFHTETVMCGFCKIDLKCNVESNTPWNKPIILQLYSCTAVQATVQKSPKSGRHGEQLYGV